MLKKLDVNYIFFATMFVFLSYLTLSHASWVREPNLFIPYALAQTFFEIGLCVFLSHLLRSWVLWAGYFFLMLIHYSDFLMVRTKGSSVSYLLKFFLGVNFDHFIAAVRSLNLNATISYISLAAIAFVPLVGLLFYKATEKISERAPLKLSFVQIGATLLSLALGLAVFDLSVYCRLPQEVHAEHVQALPLGRTFFKPTLQTLALTKPLPELGEEPTVLTPVASASLPNIYFFVIETLRRDYVNQDTAPHLMAFAQECGEFRESFSNANGTHLSWFALFHSGFPYQWKEAQERWSQGAVSLRYLKQLGYQIRVYSSADFKFYKMDEVLFGKERQLIDHIEEYANNRAIAPCDRDLLALQTASRDLENHPTATAFLLFLDSPHTEYSFPKDWPCKFLPIVKDVDYLTINAKSPALEGLKNRYRNSIHFVDHIIGGFFDTLKKKNLFKEAIIAVTGDHGEEFFEEGDLFHGTQLNVYQTSVPIFLKAGPWQRQTDIITHMDLFPSILHFLTGQNLVFGNGQSVFMAGPRTARMAVLDRGPEAPSEFLMEKEGHRIHARFTKNPLSLEIVSYNAKEDPSQITGLNSAEH